MTLVILVMALASLLGMWLAIIFILPKRIRLWLAEHPFVFLMVHVPFMVFITTIAGEGLLIGVSNLAAGLIAQVVLARWGVRHHGLTWAGKRTAKYYDLHPRKLDVGTVRRYVMVKRVALGHPDNRKAGVS